MVAVSNPTRITYEFGLFGPSAQEDIAELSLWTDFAAPGLPTDWAACLLDVATKAYNGWADHMPDSAFRPSVKLNSVKAAQMDTSLHTQREQVYAPGTLWAGSNTSISLPWQDAWCLSLYSYTPGTFIPNARNRRGRVYLPPFASTRLDITEKGTIADSTVLAILGNAKDWLNELNGQTFASMPAGTTTGLGVLSRVVNKEKLTVPNIWALTDVAADGVIDTQRRRARQEDRVRQHVGL